ncbi:MAG: hypothetical protein ACOCRK_05780 [bacterium]
MGTAKKFNYKEKKLNLLIDMLKENTGIHMLDSGSVDGRRWQINQQKDLKNEDKLKIDVCGDYVCFYMSTFHYLNTFLYLDQETDKLQAELNHMLNKYPNKPYLVVMKEFAEKNGESHYSVNTYNYDNIIDQVLQYVAVKSNLENYIADYIILQIHGGCDVRGGYTAPKIFKVHDIEYFIIAQSEINMYVKNKNFGGYSDDSGYHWYSDYDGIEISEEDFIYDEKNNKVYYQKEGDEIEFWPMLEY